MNKKVLVFFYTISLIISAHGIQKDNRKKPILAGVAPGNVVGRLGNSLWNYCHAKWVAYNTGLPFYFREFKYFKEFEFSRQEKNLKTKKTRKTVSVNGKNYKIVARQNQHRNALLIVPFVFFQDPWKTFNQIIQGYKKNKPFVEELRKKIKPVQPIKEIQKPSNMIHVALHIRKGGGYPADLEGIHKRFPLKFPPDSFYIEQLVKLSFMLNHPPMYVYIFTDDQNPQSLAQKFMNTINLPNITYDYRKTENTHNLNVIEDLFNIASFEYLIRPDSSYTRIAEIIGNHKICILPTKAHMDNEKRFFFITNVEVNIYDKSLTKFNKSLKKPLSENFKRSAFNLSC